jgi:YegS/Rv2252/BmrU family lipid kinase
MKLRFILNPKSGRAQRTARLADQLRGFIAREFPTAELTVTEGPGHATALAREAVARDFPRVVAVGGDGTMNEVAQALLHTQTALALVPCGSGNGLALHLGLPTTFAGALELAVSPAARVAAIDTGSVNGRPFFNAMGLGLDADVAGRFNRLTRRGLWAYACTALAAFRERRAEPCVISCGGHREAIDALIIAVANSDQYGNRAVIAPGARVDDGMLDLIAVRMLGVAAATGLAARLFQGSFDRSPHVRRLRGARFRIERKAPGPFHTDGETHEGAALLQVAVHPRSLRLVVPAECTAIAPVEDRLTAGFALHVP